MSEEKRSELIRVDTNAKTKDVRRIRLLWIGLLTYAFVILNAIRYVRDVPLQIFALGMVINLGVVSAILVEMRKTYKRIGPKNPS
jgi:hypothetical protein